MDISSSHKVMDRISELPSDILHECLSLMEIKNATQTSILSTKWRYLWTRLTNLDFDPKLMYPEEFDTFWENDEYETRNYFAWINQVVDMHRAPSIRKFRVHSRYVTSYATQIERWVKFALSKSVKELVLDFIGINLKCADHSKMGFPFGFDTIRHPPCYRGITALQTLHLNYVNVTDEFIEFLLSRCHHLERLCLEDTLVSNLKVKTSKLKYLTVIMYFRKLEQLEIDADNMLFFKYDDSRREGGPRMVFKSLPMLVETNFRGGLCRYPFYPVFDLLSLFTNQLCKLSFQIETKVSISNLLLFSYSWFHKLTILILVHPREILNSMIILERVIPTFPNVNHFTCVTNCCDNSSVLSLIRFIEACPELEEFKLQVAFYVCISNREASELQEIDLEDAKENVETEKDFNHNHNLDHNSLTRRAEIESMNEEKQSHFNLRILRLVGFMGVRCDVEFTLAVISYAYSLKSIICDPGGVNGDADFLFLAQLNAYDEATKRARKLAKIVSPEVNVVIL